MTWTSRPGSNDGSCQPWVMISGTASGSAERTCMKCTRCPWIIVVNCGSGFLDGPPLPSALGPQPIGG